MPSKAVSLRRRAESEPRDLVTEIDEIKHCLAAFNYDERRHATNAARKVAYVAPEAMRDCVPELAEIADTGVSASIRKDACRALGHIGRVDGRAVDALADQQLTATDEVRSAAATARNSLARASLPESSADAGGGSGDTDVFGPSPSGPETGVYGSDDGSDTEVYDAGPVGSEPAGPSDAPNFCSHCGTDLRNSTDPNFCPHCGTQV